MEIQRIKISDSERVIVSDFMKERYPDEIDFNLLMSVVQRISELDYEIIFEIKPNWEESTFSIYDCENILVDSFNISREYIPRNLIEYVWDECVCFIKWYNNQKKEWFNNAFKWLKEYTVIHDVKELPV